VQVVAPVPYVPDFLSRWDKAWPARVPNQEHIEGLTVHHPRYPLLPKLAMPLHGRLMCLESARLVRRLHQELQFDCIDAHYIYPDGFAAVRIGKALGIPVVVSARGTDINLFPSFRMIRPLICWTLREAAGIIAVSAALRDTIMGLSVAAEKIKVIGNGVDPGRFHPLDRRTARRHLRLPEQAEVLVSVGALVPSKGFQFLISAVAELIRSHPRLRLYILGEGSYRCRLEALVHAAGLEDRVLLVGAEPNQELKYWFSAADLSCLMSSREGQPNVVLESLACGTPVVATRAGGIPEILTSAQLGLLVDQEPAGIASAVNDALNQYWDREFLASHVARRTWDVVAAEVEQYLALACAAARH
jgi:teichuronic acid biosynthesis glycosyltransferase TuaC